MSKKEVKMKKFITLAVFIAALVCVMAVPAWAAAYTTPIEIYSSTTQTSWHDGKVTLVKDDTAKTAVITLNGVDIEVDGDGECGILVLLPGYDVNIIVKGENSITTHGVYNYDPNGIIIDSNGILIFNPKNAVIKGYDADSELTIVSDKNDGIQIKEPGVNETRYECNLEIKNLYLVITAGGDDIIENEEGNVVINKCIIIGSGDEDGFDIDDGDLTIENSTIDFTTESNGFDVDDGNVTIRNCSGNNYIKIVSTSDEAINVDDAGLIITNSTVDLTSAAEAIEVDPICEITDSIVRIYRDTSETNDDFNDDELYYGILSYGDFTVTDSCIAIHEGFDIGIVVGNKRFDYYYDNKVTLTEPYIPAKFKVGRSFIYSQGRLGSPNSYAYGTAAYAGNNETFAYLVDCKVEYPYEDELGYTERTYKVIKEGSGSSKYTRYFVTDNTYDTNDLEEMRPVAPKLKIIPEITIGDIFVNGNRATYNIDESEYHITLAESPDADDFNVKLNERLFDYYVEELEPGTWDVTVTINGCGCDVDGCDCESAVCEVYTVVVTIQPTGGEDAEDPTPDPEQPTRPAIPAWLPFTILAATEYTIDVEAGEGGYATPEGKTKVRYGETFTASFMPMEGYIIKAVYVDNKNVGTPDEYTFDIVYTSHTVRVEYEPDPDYIAPGAEDAE